ncbi:MAG: ATP-binding cassette domain-containing protein [Verrucomicrobiota bacterium]
MKGECGEAEGACVIEARGLSVERSRVILRDVNWRVRQGEHWVVMGSNGSGKTALMRSLSGYMTLSRGSVVIAGYDEDEPWDVIQQRVGIVSSNVAQQIDADEPVLETVISGRYAMINYWVRRQRREDRTRAREVLERVECAHLEKIPWAVLSQGERQRVMIGRALMLEEPRVLLLDEPCAGLDPVARERFLQFLGRLGDAEGRGAPTVILVTHHVEEIIPMFTHALMLRAGRVVRAGRVSDCLRSECLSEVFGAPVSVRRRRGRYQLEVVGGDGAFLR